MSVVLRLIRKARKRYRKKAKEAAAKRKPAPRPKAALNEPQLRQLLAAVNGYRTTHPNSRLAITVCGRTDGAGAQALGIVSALLWAEATGCRYLHSPFRIMAHAVDSRAAWAARWERFLNLGYGEAPVPPNALLVPATALLDDPEACDKPGSVLAAQYYHWRDFQTPEALQRMGPVLRAKYSSTRKSPITVHRAPPGALTVAVHVRRGDINPDDPRKRSSFTPNEPILNTIECLKSVARNLGRSLHINLFSEGPQEMFDAFAKAGCRLHLDGDAFEAFHNLVSADLLVQAKSSFSYIAGLISTGAVLHERYFYRPAAGWMLRDDAGAFDAAALHRALAAMPIGADRTPRPSPLQRFRRWLPPA